MAVIAVPWRSLWPAFQISPRTVSAGHWRHSILVLPKATVSFRIRGTKQKAIRRFRFEKWLQDFLGLGPEEHEPFMAMVLCLVAGWTVCPGMDRLIDVTSPHDDN